MVWTKFQACAPSPLYLNKSQFRIMLLAPIANAQFSMIIMALATCNCKVMLPPPPEIIKR